MRRPGMEFSGLGAVVLEKPDAVLVSQLNRFTGPKVDGAQRVSATPFSVSGGITEDVAMQTLIVALRRLRSAVGDEGAAKMTEEITKILAAGQLGGSATIEYVNGHIPELAATLKSFGDSLSLPPAGGTAFGFPIKTVAIAAGAVAIGAFLFFRGRK